MTGWAAILISSAAVAISAWSWRRSKANAVKAEAYARRAEQIAEQVEKRARGPQ